MNQQADTTGYDEVFKDASDVGYDIADAASGTAFTGTKKYRICTRKSDVDEIAQNAGKFRTLDDEGNRVFVDEIKAVWLDMSGFREFYRGDEFVCSSSDAQESDQDASKQCATCPDKGSGEGKCPFGVRLLMIDAEDPESEPFILQCTSTGWPPVRDAARECQTKFKRPIFSAVWRVSTTKFDSKFGIQMVPVLKPIKALDKEYTEFYRQRRIAEIHRLKKRGANATGQELTDMIGEEFHDEDAPFPEEGG